MYTRERIKEVVEECLQHYTMGDNKTDKEEKKDFVSNLKEDFSNATSVTLPAATVPLINPKVEYVNCGAITASGATVPLPNNLTFISSSAFEYIEIFINGLRMRYDVDFAPRSTSTIQYFVTIPSGSEITYKSLNRP